MPAGYSRPLLLVASALLAAGCGQILGTDDYAIGLHVDGGELRAALDSDAGARGAELDGLATAGDTEDTNDAGPPVIEEDAGDPNDGTGVLGAPCSRNGDYACAGHAQRGQLVCRDGVWTENGSCLSGTHCDTRAPNAGFCDPIDPACDGARPGDLVCRGDVVVECGPDLVSTTVESECDPSSATPHCNAGVCGPCDGDVDCEGKASGETCVMTGDLAGACRECDPGDDRGCSGTNNRCEPSTLTCVDCFGDADCDPASAAPRCDVNARTCSLCLSDSDCAGNANGEVCVTSGASAGRCAACDPADHTGCDWPTGRCDSGTLTCGAAPSCVSSSTTCGSSGTGGSGGTAGAGGLTGAGAMYAMGGMGAYNGYGGAGAGMGMGGAGGTGAITDEHDCCSSPAVAGGSFSPVNDDASLATVSGFLLDRYEVTVARFERFVDAWIGGWRPAPGDGKHAHLNEGRGLVMTDGGFESGWISSWTDALASTESAWDTNLSCSPDYETWASTSATRPQNCVTWQEAYAFCIWDGGFLPSEAEWNYAAAGGDAQRSYPWGETVPGADAALAVYGCFFSGSGTCTGLVDIAPVGSIRTGNGRYGQADLAGNLWEWTIDWYEEPLSETCADCAGPSSGTMRVRRGSSFNYPAESLLTSQRSRDLPTNRHDDVGFRCARSP